MVSRASEVAANVNDVTSNGSLATPHLIYSTAAQNFGSLRQAYQSEIATYPHRRYPSLSLLIPMCVSLHLISVRCGD